MTLPLSSLSLRWLSVLVSVLLFASPVSAQPVTEKTPAAVPPALTHLGAQPGETVRLAQLTGIKFLGLPDQVVKTGVTVVGGDVSQVPLLQTPDFVQVLKTFLGHPVSFESLERLTVATRTYLEAIGYPFLTIYLPAQDITTGTVQVVVTAGRLDDIVKVEGAKYFSERHYRTALTQRPGQPINSAELKADLDWLNRNPFRQVTAVAEPGPRTGTTALRLRVDERLPLRLTAGYSNTGSLVSDEDRVSAGFTWGNAFGRGDQLGYQYSASPDAKTSVTHSANYSLDLPWRHTVRVSGAYSELTGRVAAPLALTGRNAQLGLRYEIPLRPLRPRVSQSLAVSFDFKASDNNLLFAAFPITDNLTHIAQFGAAYTLGFAGAGSQTELGALVFASPGGLTTHNRSRAFDLSRSGARPDYAYGQLSVRRQQALPRGFAWSARAQLQIASGNLLGSEQFAGGGSASVRGYEEGEAYGDHGALVSHELALPATSLARLLRLERVQDSLQLFAFQDAAALRSARLLPFERRTTTLHSLGAGLRWQLGRFLSVEAVHGWQLRDSGVSRSGDNARTHLSAQAAF